MAFGERSNRPVSTWQSLLTRAARMLTWAAEKVEDREVRAKIRELASRAQSLAEGGA